MTLDVDLRDRPGLALATIRADLAEVRSDLVAQREALTSEIDGLDRAIEALGGGDRTVPPAPKVTSPGSSNGATRPPARTTQAEPTCDVCGHKAKNANGLKIHKGRAHGTTKPVRETPPPAEGRCWRDPGRPGVRRVQPVLPDARRAPAPPPLVRGE